MTRAAVAIILLLSAMSSCGALTPHVAVDATVSGDVTGKVDTSGTITVSLDPSTLFSFFLTECRTSLGAMATEEQVAACATDATNHFLTAFGGLHG